MKRSRVGRCCRPEPFGYAQEKLRDGSRFTAGFFGYGSDGQEWWAPGSLRCRVRLGGFPGFHPGYDRAKEFISVGWAKPTNKLASTRHRMVGGAHPTADSLA